jgi:hypothetical protein
MAMKPSTITPVTIEVMSLIRPPVSMETALNRL